MLLLGPNRLEGLLHRLASVSLHSFLADFFFCQTKHYFCFFHIAHRNVSPLSVLDLEDRRPEGRVWAALMAGVRNLGSRKQPSSSGITARAFLLPSSLTPATTTKHASGTASSADFKIKSTEESFLTWSRF